MNSAPSSGFRPHLDSLTGIRGIAAWLVVFYHVRKSLFELVPGPVIDVAAKGYLAVDLFFVLSGFVLWWNYADRLRSGAAEERIGFLWRRFARVWPLHAFILCLFVALALALAATGRSTAPYPFAELPLHFLLMNNWGLTTELTWNDPSWSISAELAAYAVFPIVLCLAKWDRLPSSALVAIALGLSTCLWAMFAAHGLDGMGDQIWRMGVWRCIAQFLMGNIACILWLRWRDRAGASAAVAGACGATLVAGLALGLPETAIVPTVFTCFILSLALGKGWFARLMSARPIVYLGEISYSTYLAHFLFWIIFKMLFVDETLQLSWPLFGFFLLSLFVASAALYHGVERPAQRWLNRHRPGTRQAVPAE